MDDGIDFKERTSRGSARPVHLYFVQRSVLVTVYPKDKFRWKGKVSSYLIKEEREREKERVETQKLYNKNNQT